jgi:hypothetical protein
MSVNTKLNIIMRCVGVLGIVTGAIILGWALHWTVGLALASGLIWIIADFFRPLPFWKRNQRHG